MKKGFALLLTLALVAGFSVASFAAELPAAQNKDLAVDYTAATAADTVYSVDIAWDNDLEFNYVAGTQGAWNPDDHAYADATGAKWDDADVNVKVTNHSNAKVEASIAIENFDGKVTVAANQASATLESAVDTAVAEAPAFTFVLTVSGVPTESITKVATATVSFKAAE